MAQIAREPCDVDYRGVETAHEAVRRAEEAVGTCDNKREIAVKHVDSLRKHFRR